MLETQVMLPARRARAPADACVQVECGPVCAAARQEAEVDIEGF